MNIMNIQNRDTQKTFIVFHLKQRSRIKNVQKNQQACLRHSIYLL